MRRPTNVAAAVALIAFFSSSIAAESEKMSERPSQAGSRDVKIPRSLVQQLDKDYRAFLTKNEVSAKENIKRMLMNVSAELTQKRDAALHENLRVNTPLGGGIIDLSEIVTPVRGSFSLKIMTKKEDGNQPSNLRVYFVSRGKQRRVDGEDYGAGCGRYMDVTSYFNKKMSKSGFELYTANQRYLSVVGGTFVAVGFEKEAMQVGTLTFTDSRYPELLCE